LLDGFDCFDGITGRSYHWHALAARTGWLEFELCSKGFGSVEKSIAVQCQKARPALQIEGGVPSVFLRGVPVEREIISRYNRPVFYPPPLPQKDVDTESNGNDRNGIN